MKKYLLSMLLSLFGLYSMAQDEIVADVNVIPPSPAVSAIQIFVDVPVSLYTGTPEISIPLYVLQTPQLQLPISLNYHASGLKVEEHASWVGAGWSLNAGGVVSRTIRGLADELSVPALGYGWFHTEHLYQNGIPDINYTEGCVPPILQDYQLNAADSLGGWNIRC